MGDLRSRMANSNSMPVGLGRGNGEMLGTLTAYYEFSEDIFLV